MSQLRQHYKENIMAEMIKLMGYQNVMQVPKVTKVTLNMGLGNTDKHAIADAVEALSLIAGQQAVVTKTKLAVAGFRIRKGWPIGCKVVLRNQNMYDFLERLLYIALPRVRDFRGLNPKSFDGRGNYSFGIVEHIVFPEIDYDKVKQVLGLDICITTSAKNDKDAYELLRLMQFPFRGTRVAAQEEATASDKDSKQQDQEKA